MRKQRPAMVQTKDQYVLVYKAVFHLVRKYLDDYQHDPSVLHMFDESVAEKLSQITLPEPQNPSGIDEVACSTELGGEVEEDFASSELIFKYFILIKSLVFRYIIKNLKIESMFDYS